MLLNLNKASIRQPTVSRGSGTPNKVPVLPAARLGITAAKRTLLPVTCRSTEPETISTSSEPVHEEVELAASKPGWWNKEVTPNMRDVQGIQELVDQLATAGDKLVVVEFYASWCNACKALYPKLVKLLHEHGDEVLFLKVNYDDNKDMCRTMDIKVLPSFHFYRGAEGRVEAFTCTISKIQRFKDALDMYTAAFCSLDQPPGVAEFPEVSTSAAFKTPDFADDTTNGGKGNGNDGDGMIEAPVPTQVDRPTKLNNLAWS